MKVSFFKRATTKKVSKEVNLKQWLKDTINPPSELKSTVLKYRAFKSKRTKAQLPCITISASFKKVRNLKKIKEKTGLICLDIDRNSNPCINMAEARAFFTSHPSTLYSGFSVGNDGVYVILKIDKKKALIKYFKFFKKRLKDKGIIIDESCKDYTRLRFFSYDEDAYYNPKAEVFKLPKKPKPIQGGGTNTSRSDLQKVETVVALIEQNSIDITQHYDDWVKVAGALYNAFGENGRDFFHRISVFYPEYKKKETDRKFDGCRNMSRITLSSLFHITNSYGVRY